MIEIKYAKVSEPGISIHTQFFDKISYFYKTVVNV